VPAGGPASSLALIVLVGLAVATPWAFGSVDPRPRLALVLAALVTCGVATAWSAAGSDLRLPDAPLWPILALLGLGVLQLVPLPAPLLALLSPGSAEVWYPATSDAVRRVLGDGPRPISLDAGATGHGLLLAAGLVGLALLSVSAIARTSQALRAAFVLTLAGTALAVFGILARSRFGSLIYGYIEVPTVSPFGPFVSKNHFAGYMAPLALFAVGFGLGLAGRARETEWTRDRSAPGVVLALVGAMAMAIAIFVSHSRGGALAVTGGGLALAAFVFAERRRARLLAPAAAVAVALLAVVALTLPEEARARVSTLEGASFRVDTWRDGVRLAARSPLVGHGFAAFADAFPRMKRGHGDVRVEHAENEYVELLVEGGALGLGLAVLALILPARAIVTALRERSPLHRGLAVGALAGLVALAAHSAFDFNLRIPSNATLAAVLASMAAAGTGLRGRPVGRPGLVIGALAFAAGAVLAAASGTRGFDRTAVFRDVREEAQAAVASPTAPGRALRSERARARLGALLRVRPALAEGWLILAALDREAGDLPRARQLAAHALWLDPSRPELRAAVERVQSE
jgi:O-antigen ligase